MKKIALIAAFSIVWRITPAAPVPKVAPQTVAPLQVKTLAMQADAQTRQLIQHEETRVITFYDEQWQPLPTPIVGGYYRMLLGRTTTGQAVVQDFYQDTRTPQSYPVPIAEDRLTESDMLAVNGRVVWLSPEGDITKFVVVKDEQIVQAGSYTEDGALQLAFQRKPQTEHLWAYYPNGKLLAYATKNQRQTRHYLFDERGRFLIDDASAKTINSRHPKIAEIQKAASLYAELLRNIAPQIGI